MNVRCPSCRTLFRVDPAKVPEAGIRARCTVCAATLDVRRDGAPAQPSPPRAQARASSAAPEPAGPSRVAPSARPTPAAPRTPRLSQPFYQPRGSKAGATPPAAPEAPEAPSRPSAPVFRPTPGQPLTRAPEPPAAPPKVPPAPPKAAPAAPAAPARPAAAAPPPPPSAPAAPAAAGAPAARRPINPFLQQDPEQKARRLARALVSDMIVYQPDKRQRALADGTLKDAFDEEIKKSWEEYLEQVGEDMANSTSYWRDALNEILAGGQKIF